MINCKLQCVAFANFAVQYLERRWAWLHGYWYLYSIILVQCAVGNLNVSKSIAYSVKMDMHCRLAAELELAKRDIAQNTEDIMNMGGKATKVQYSITFCL